MKKSKYSVFYNRHTLTYVEDKDSLRKAVQFVNFLDSYGGYAFKIAIDGIISYRRYIDDEKGDDYWTDKDGNVITLEQIEYRK